MDSAAKGTPSMILIVPVLNRYDLLERMVASIDYEISDLLIIDNGGELKNLDRLQAVKRIHILTMPSNLGVAGSWNLGIKCFPFEKYWTITSADTVFKAGALAKLAEASRSDALTLTADFPHYQLFSVGEKLVQEVGLFDESIYPIYFEDNDYERRVTKASFDIVRAEISTHHDNSSTIHSDEHYAKRNGLTFLSNHSYYQQKCDNDDYSEGRWNLERIRENSWHK